MAMTRILAFSRPSPERGFTLLELLLVLALAATAATLTLPSVFSAMRAADDRRVVAEVEALLLRLPNEAAVLRQPSQWRAPALMARLPEFSPAWQLRLERPLELDARGMSEGGFVQLWHGDRLAQAWRLRAGDGRPQRVPSGEVNGR